MNYRKSHYCIDVKLDKAEGKYMLIHSYTGALDIVSEELVKYLKSTKEFNKESFPFPDNTFDLLEKRGHITRQTLAEEMEHVRRFADLLHGELKKAPKTFLFMVTYDCNFRCAYCYEGGISKQGNQWSGKKFTPEMVDRAYAAMEELEPNKDKRNKKIVLYGGEPLLKNNIDIVKYIIEKGSSRGYEFEAITNGHDLNYYESLLTSGAIKKLQITLDGAAEMHDSRRYHHETGNSFDIIFKNIRLALDNNVSVTVRINVDAKNFEEIEKLKTLFDEVGYSAQKHFFFYTALLRPDQNTIDENSSLMNIGQIGSNEIKDGGIEYLTIGAFNALHKERGLKVTPQDYGLYEKLSKAINNGTYLLMEPVFCAVGANMYIFDPFGNLYNCWETVGIKRHISGNYSKAIEFSDERARWRDRNIGNTPRCSACKYSLLCGGGCLAKALRFGGGFDKSYCDNYGDILQLSANTVFDNWMDKQIPQTQK